MYAIIGRSRILWSCNIDYCLKLIAFTPKIQEGFELFYEKGYDSGFDEEKAIDFYESLEVLVVVVFVNFS